MDVPGFGLAGFSALDFFLLGLLDSLFPPAILRKLVDLSAKVNLQSSRT